MWKRVLFVILLFYVFALLQNSFLAYFAIFGSAPNLIFTLFFLLIFFSLPEQNFPGEHKIILWAIVAGFFLDIYSFNYIGPSIVLLLIVGFLTRKTKGLLRSTDDKFPFIYFLSLFIIFFVILRVLQIVYLRFLDPSHYIMIFDARIFVDIIYNLIFAIIGFSIFKKITNVKKISG